jgi:hypothetical protein
MSNPIYILALAVVKQAMIDYYRSYGHERRDAELFLRGEGRKLWLALGLDEEVLDEFLENPSEIRRWLLAGRRPKR